MRVNIDTITELQAQIEVLTSRLEQTEEALRAIQTGEVDALVVHTDSGDRVFTLQDADEPYRVMVETMNEGAATLLQDGTVMYCNNRLAEMIGLPLEKLLGNCLYNYIRHKDKYHLVETIGNAIKEQARIEASLICSDGTHLPVLISLKSINIDSDRPAVCMLITSLVQQKHNQELLEEMVAQRTAELLRSNKDLEDFTSTISHDLQEPLRKIQGFGNLLFANAGNPLSEEEIDYIRRMQRASQRMAVMIEDLLSVSRITTSSHSFDSVDLNQVLQEVLSDLDMSIQVSHARVEIGALPVIEAEPLQMQQLFQNLLSNAIKFHKPKESPRVTVTSREVHGNNHRGKSVEITVADNGIGFSEEYVEQLFQPFRRLVGRSQYEGTGMGLVICRKIVERHGGSITAKSRPDEGSSFIVRLPLKKESD
jgi:PAS domain S-box-containing protein